MTLTEAKKTITRLRKAGILAKSLFRGFKKNGGEVYQVIEAGISKGHTEPRVWDRPPE